MKISDEIRKWCDSHEGTRVDGYDCDNLRDLADRIDNEMVELPKDADGVPIHVGDTVWNANKNAMECTVASIELYGDITKIFISCRGTEAIVGPTGLTHGRHDSWERIADELDEMVDAADSADDNCEKLADFAERIRMLAEKEASNDAD